MAEQHLDDADVGAALQQMGGEAVPQRVHRHPLVKPAAAQAERQAACKTLGIDRPLVVAARETAIAAAAPAASRRAGSAAAAATA